MANNSAKPINIVSESVEEAMGSFWTRFHSFIGFSHHSPSLNGSKTRINMEFRSKIISTLMNCTAAFNASKDFLNGSISTTKHLKGSLQK